MTVGAREGAAWSVHPPTAGLLAYLALLATLAATVGLGAVGWLVGAGCGLVAWALLSRARYRAPVRQWGPADTVTLARATLVGAVTALVADSWQAQAQAPVAVLVGLAAAALLLDAVDGLVARRTGTASPLGARFDMETDAFLVLVLAVFVAGSLGWWVLAVGAPRYVFAAAGGALPWLRRPVPARRSGKTLAAVQGTALATASAGFIPAPVMSACLAAVLVLLTWSFGRDIGWLWRVRHREPGDDAAGDVIATTRAHRVASPVIIRRAITGTACVLVLLALTVPNRLDHLTPTAFLRIPAEGIIAAGLLLLLPLKVGRVVAGLAGAVIGVLALLKIVDMGFFAVLARPFDPVLDWPLLGAAVGFLTEATGRATAIGAVVAAALLVAVAVTLTALSAVRLTRLAVRHRMTAAGVVAVLGVAWVTSAAVGVQIEPGVPVAAHQYDRMLQVHASLQDRQEFAAEVAVDEFRHTSGEELLTALRGKDVIVAFVESYGRAAVADPELAPRVGEVLAAGQRRLDAAGFASRSAFLTAPTVGGGSWLSHATLRSGAWVDNQQRYRTLVGAGSDRLTIPGAFQRAGWRTVGVMPATLEAWPEGELFGFDRVYGASALGYRGPRLNWGVVPDQYSLAALERLERAPADRPPVMAEVALLSSHVPWTPPAPLVDWADVDDGSIFHSVAPQADAADDVLRDRAAARDAYGHALTYSLDTLISYVETYGDEDLVMVILGDHQPPPLVTGQGAGADVPVTILAGDPAVLERISTWGWHPGLEPGPQSPVWRMDTFRGRFLTAFGPRGRDR